MIYIIEASRATISLQNDTIINVCDSLPTTLNKSNQINIILKVRDGIRMIHSVCIVVRRAEIDFSAIYFDATNRKLYCIIARDNTVASTSSWVVFSLNSYYVILEVKPKRYRCKISSIFTQKMLQRRVKKNGNFCAVSSNSASNHPIFLEITTHMDP
jgi:hypothetical protein